MTFVDWLIVLFTLLLGLRGYTRGFLVGALSLIGFGLGAYVGTRIGLLVLPKGAHSPYAPLFGLPARCWPAVCWPAASKGSGCRLAGCSGFRDSGSWTASWARS